MTNEQNIATVATPTNRDADRADVAALLVRVVELAIELTTITAELEALGGAEATQARHMIAALLARPRRGVS